MFLGRFSRRRLRAHLFTAASLTALSLSPLPSPAQTATWLSPISGTWSDPANWSTNPTYPNDPSADALLSATGSPYTVTLNSPISLNSLTGTSPDATFNLATGGTLTLSSSLDLGPGSFTLNGGTISGGTLSSSLTGAGTLNSTSLASTLTLPNFNTVTLSPTFTLAPTGSIHLTGPTSKITLSGTTSATLSGSGQVVFDDTSGSATGVITGSNSPTIGPNITIRTGIGSGTVGDNSVTYTTIPLVNQGTISAETPGQILNLFAKSLTNTGIIQSTNNSTLRLWGTFTPTTLMSISTTNGGVAYAQTGSVGPSSGSASYTLSSNHAVGIGMDSIFQHLTISSSDTTPLSVYPFTSTSHPTPTGTATLTSCNVLAPLSITPGATLLSTFTTLAGAITANAGTLIATTSSTITGSLTATNASTLTLATTAACSGSISLSTSTLNLNTTPASLGSLSLTNSSTLNLNAAPPTSFTNPVSFSDSTLNINTSLSASQFAKFAGSRTNSPINISASSSIANTGNTIPLTAATGPLNLLSGPTTGASITGGTLGTTPDGLINLYGNASLTSVTLAGTLSIASRAVAAAHTSLTLNNAHISLNPGNPQLQNAYTLFTIDSLTGTGVISFDGANDNTHNEDVVTTNIPTGVTVLTGSHSGEITVTTLAGTISAQTTGTGIFVRPSVITGTIQATSPIYTPSYLQSAIIVSALDAPFSDINTTHTLTSGTWIASNATLEIVGTNGSNPIVPITTLGPAASVTLSGYSTTFSSLISTYGTNGILVTNNGSLTLSNNYHFDNTTNFTNTGSIAVNTSARAFTNSITNSGSISLDSASCYTGTLSNTNSITLANSAYFSASTSLTNSGSITLGASSTLYTSAIPSNTGSISLTAPDSLLLVNYTGASPIDDLRAQILTHHITTPLPNTAIAYAEAATLFGLTGSQTTTYHGQTIDATTLLLLPTLPGDANLDGKINADDYALLDRSYAQSLASAHWQDGDFNYDGVVNSADYLLIDTTLAQSQPLSPFFLSQRESQFGAAYIQSLLTSVPEPTLAFTLFAALPFLRRRNYQADRRAVLVE